MFVWSCRIVDKALEGIRTEKGEKKLFEASTEACIGALHLVIRAYKTDDSIANSILAIHHFFLNSLGLRSPQSQSQSPKLSGILTVSITCSSF